MWLALAVLSAVFAGITSILAKCGIRKTDSDIATAIRTFVVLIFSFVMVFVTDSFSGFDALTLKSAIYLILSGLATGFSWICYFKALSKADVNKVVPIDKSSAILSLIIAIIVFGETNGLVIKIVSMIIISIGIALMIEKKDVVSKAEGGWFIYAVLSAVFASLTSVLGKIGVTGIPSNLGTALRTIVVLLMAWAIVIGKGKLKDVKHTDRRELIFMVLSGIATGASWLCYYAAIQSGVVSIVVPIDKLSILVSVSFSVIFLKEKMSLKSVIGLGLMVAGTLIMTLFT